MDGGDSYERARPRLRSRSPDGPPARRYRDTRSRSRSRDRGDRDRFPPPSRRRSRSRSPPRRRSGGDRYDDRHDDRRYDSRRGGRDDDRYSSSRGGDRDRQRDRDDDRRSNYRETTDRAANREAVAQEAIKNSKKENRVYVGNLSFQVRWHDLKDFCSAAGDVIFAEIIQLPNGMSKGCGIVEYATREEAERAVRDLNEGQLFGRPAFLREDREDEARFGAAAISGRTTFPGASQQGGAPSSRGSRESGVPAVFAPPGPRGLFVTGMTPEIGWQDMKDLFRRAGEVQRADVNIDHSTGISKGTGVVVMANKADADEAIAMFNGYEFEGGRLEVREDRFFHINQARAQARGGRPPRDDRDGDRGGYGGDRSTDDLYGEYSGRGGGDYGRRGGDDYDRDRYGGGRGPPSGPSFGREPIRADPSAQIFVNNLPWSTSNEDLVELFQTTGTVVAAEMIWENGRSKGNGIVQFDNVEQADSAIQKFSGYLYGGRPLKLAFNARWKTFDTFLEQPANAAAGNEELDAAANGSREEEMTS